MIRPWTLALGLSLPLLCGCAPRTRANLERGWSSLPDPAWVMERYDEARGGVLGKDWERVERVWFVAGVPWIVLREDSWPQTIPLGRIAEAVLPAGVVVVHKPRFVRPSLRTFATTAILGGFFAAVAEETRHVEDVVLNQRFLRFSLARWMPAITFGIGPLQHLPPWYFLNPVEIRAKLLKTIQLGAAPDLSCHMARLRFERLLKHASRRTGRSVEDLRGPMIEPMAGEGLWWPILWEEEI